MTEEELIVIEGWVKDKPVYEKEDEDITNYANNEAQDARDNG